LTIQNGGDTLTLHSISLPSSKQYGFEQIHKYDDEYDKAAYNNNFKSNDKVFN